MAWTDPAGHVFATGEIVTAATLNTYVKDNLLDLDRRTTTTSATVNTLETSSNTSYIDLATAGPAVTVTIGANGLSMIDLFVSTSNSLAGQQTFTGYAVSGASTIAAQDALLPTLIWTSPTNAGGIQFGGSAHGVGLTPGSNTFTCKYKVTANTGSWQRRHIAITPLGS